MSSVECLESLCPTYKTALLNVIFSLDHTDTVISKIKILTNFSQKYTMPPLYWKRLIELSAEKRREKITKEACSHFFIYNCYTKDKKTYEWCDFSSIYCDAPKDPDNIEAIKNKLKKGKEALMFPHKTLPMSYNFYKSNLMKPMEKSVKIQYEKSLFIFNKLIKATKSPQKWFKCLEEIEDKEIVIANIESYLSQSYNWSNKIIWKYYINFFKSNSQIKTLNAYRRYCRLFISDKKIQEEYRKEIENFHLSNFPVAAFWIDTIQFEYDFCNEKAAFDLLERAMTSMLQKPYKIAVKKQKFETVFEKYSKQLFELERNLPASDSCMEIIDEPIPLKTLSKSFNKNLHFQNFSLPRTLIHYMTKSAKVSVLRKLFQCCKLFFQKIQTPICYRFRISENRSINLNFIEESLLLSEKDVKNPALKNFHISDIIICYAKNRSALSKVISLIANSDATYIRIWNQDLSFKELQKLAKPKSLSHFHLRNTNIFDGNGAIMDFNVLKEMFLKNEPCFFV